MSRSGGTPKSQEAACAREGDFYAGTTKARLLSTRSVLVGVPACGWSRTPMRGGCHVTVSSRRTCHGVRSQAGNRGAREQPGGLW